MSNIGHQAKVFAEQIDRKTWVEVLGDDLGAEVGQGPGATSPGRNGIYHYGRIETGLLRKGDALTAGQHVQSDEKLVARLGSLSGADRTDPDDFRAQDFKQGKTLLENLFVASDHYRQRSLACAHGASGNRCVEILDAFGSEIGTDVEEGIVLRLEEDLMTRSKRN